MGPLYSMKNRGVTWKENMAVQAGLWSGHGPLSASFYGCSDQSPTMAPEHSCPSHRLGPERGRAFVLPLDSGLVLGFGQQNAAQSDIQSLPLRAGATPASCVGSQPPRGTFDYPAGKEGPVDRGLKPPWPLAPRQKHQMNPRALPPRPQSWQIIYQCLFQATMFGVLCYAVIDEWNSGWQTIANGSSVIVLGLCALLLINQCKLGKQIGPSLVTFKLQHSVISRTGKDVHTGFWQLHPQSPAGKLYPLTGPRSLLPPSRPAVSNTRPQISSHVRKS